MGPKSLPIRPVPCLCAQNSRNSTAQVSGQDQRFGPGGGNFEALQGGEDGNDRGDQAVAVEQGGAEEPGQDQASAQVGPQAFVEQGQHGEDAAFPLVVGPEDEQGILQADHQGQRPKNQGNQAQDIGRSWFDGGMAAKTDFKGIQRAGADVAEDDPQGGQDQDTRFFSELRAHAASSLYR